MSRELSALFQEEASALQQSQVLHLITIEIMTLTTGTAANNSTYISVANTTELSEGQYVTIDGVDGIRQVVTVEVPEKRIIINEPTDAAVAEAQIRLVLPLADSNYAVSFDGVTYIQFPAKFSEIAVNSDGTIDKASLSVANVSREIMYYIEMYDGLRDRLVTVKTLFQKFLDYTYSVDLYGNVTKYDNPDADPSAYVEDSFRVDSYSADENVVVIQLEPSSNLSVKLPHRRYTSDSCYWRYRDPDTCGFDLDAFILQENLTQPTQIEEYTVCNKMYTECARRRNAARFGGFPGISGQRRVFL
jgi:lambda family phage minor tail protein L